MALESHFSCRKSKSGLMRLLWIVPINTCWKKSKSCPSILMNAIRLKNFNEVMVALCVEVDLTQQCIDEMLHPHVLSDIWATVGSLIKHILSYNSTSSQMIGQNTGKSVLRQRRNDVSRVLTKYLILPAGCGLRCS